MKKRYAAAFFAAGIICASVCPAAITAGANSASPYWDGEDGRGVYSADQNCPLQVKSENLTFDITGFPDEGEYTSSVRAEYNFYNPTDGDITARMWFPFGKEPDYYNYFEDADITESLYGVTVNGESAEANIRYSYCYNNNFDFGEDGAYLSDEKASVNHLREDAAVTKVTIGETAGGYAVVNYTLTRNKTTMLTYYEEYQYVSADDAAISAYFVLDLAKYDYFYIIGDMPTSLEVNEGEYISGSSRGYSTMTLVTGESLACGTENAGTLAEFLQGYNILGDGKYSETDWFNFCVYSLDEYISYYWQGCSCLLDDFESNFPNNGISGRAMRWYDYTITVKAGGYALNTVTAPTYPTIDQSTDPFNYIYSYLLSPAATWSGFENLTITVNAAYYMLSSSAEFTLSGSVEGGDSVYTATYESLPSGELYFTLCLDENPKSTNNFNWTILIILIIGVFYVIPAAALIAGIIILVIFLVRHRRKTKGNLQ